jgi:hypothetical protein
MSDYFTLRFDSESDVLATAEALRLLPPTDEPTEIPDLLIISQTELFGQAQLITNVQIPGTYDPDTGEELSPPIPVSGLFFNVVLNRPVLHSELQRRQVPYGAAGQVWAGTEPEPGAWPPAES